MSNCQIIECDCAEKAGELASKTRHIRKAALHIASLEEDCKSIVPLSREVSRLNSVRRRLRLALTNLVADVNEAKVLDWQSLSEAEALLASERSEADS